MNDKKNNPMAIPLPADFTSVEAIINLLKAHPDIAHFNLVLSDELDELERMQKTHLNVPVKDKADER